MDRIMSVCALILVLGILLIVAFLAVHSAQMEKAGYVYRTEWVKIN